LSAVLREVVCANAETTARAAAAQLVVWIRDAVQERGRCMLAFSGGRSPRALFRALAGESVPWDRVELFQVDERDAPEGDVDRNWTQLSEELVARVPLPPEQRHPIPVGARGAGGSLERAAQRYAQLLESLGGTPPRLDVVHLGLGTDGHTASLVPGDPVLAVRDRSVATTRAYAGYRRVTLTYPTLDAARHVLWLVVGPEKREAVARLRAGDLTIPAARVARTRAVLVRDAADDD